MKLGDAKGVRVLRVKIYIVESRDHMGCCITI